MQYNDGNKTRQKEEERESLRVLSSVRDNCNIRKRDTERSAICIHLADQNKVTLRLKAKNWSRVVKVFFLCEVGWSLRYFKYFPTQL